MKASGAYRVLHQRDSRVPSRLDPLRYDSIEVVEVATNETVLFWDLPSKEAAKRVRALREDLSRLNEYQFLERWERVT